MSEFDRRLASRLAAYEESVPAPTIAGATTVPASRSRPRPALLLVPAAVVVVIGVVFGLAGSGVLTGVRPAGNAPVTSLEWTTHPFIPGARVVQLTAVGDRLIATGSLNNQAAAWYSDDGGETWIAAKVEAAAQRGDAQLAGMTHSLGEVAEHDGRLVSLDAYSSATIGLGSIASPDESVRTLAWTSSDTGATWVAGDGVHGGAGVLTPTAKGFAALGKDPDGHARAWTSADGSAWSESEIVGIEPNSTFTDAAFDGSRLILAGATMTSRPAGSGLAAGMAAMLWTSDDGQRWVSGRLDEEELGLVRAIAVDGSSVVLAGGVYQPGAESRQHPVWWTPDAGAEWNEHALPIPPEGVGSDATAIARNGWGMLLRETRYDRNFSLSLVNGLWFVPRAGSSLVREQGLNRQIAAIAALPDRFVVISQCDENGDCDAPAVSIGKPSHAPPMTPPPSAVRSPTESRAPGPSTVPSPKPSPRPTPPPASGTPTTSWSTSTIAAGDSVAVARVVEVPDGLMAIGTEDWNGAIWHSLDGRSWQPIADVPVVASDKAVRLTNLAYTPVGYVATGVWGPRSSEEGGMVVWTSTDGTHWQDATDWSRSGSILAITATSDGLFAVGGQLGLGYGNGAAAWTSADGVNWTEARVGNSENATMIDVIAVRDGFISVGLQRTNSGFRPAVWRSSDGLKWEQTAPPAEITDGAMNAVAAVNGVLVAIGTSPTDAEDLGVMWLSNDDGITWKQTYNATCCHTLTGLATTTIGFVVSGTTINGSGTVALKSTDGTNWQVDSARIAPTTLQGLLGTQRLGLLAWSGSQGETDSIYSILFAPPSERPMSRDEAIAAASEYLQSGESATLLAAEEGLFGRFELHPNAKASPPPPDTIVWRVIFDTGDGGQIRIVILDARSGDLIETVAAIAN